MSALCIFLTHSVKSVILNRKTILRPSNMLNRINKFFNRIYYSTTSSKIQQILAIKYKYCAITPKNFHNKKMILLLYNISWYSPRGITLWK